VADEVYDWRAVNPRVEALYERALARTGVEAVA
jgi:hypothetical protein